jgi:hypothetical protein
LGGKTPFQVSILDLQNDSNIWVFTLHNNSDTSILFSSLEFPTQGTFQVHVIDINEKMAVDSFSLRKKTGTSIDPQKSHLTLKCTPDEATKELKILVKGNQPPFKVFLNQKPIATLKKAGWHKQKYVASKLKDGQLVEVLVKDNMGETKTASVKIKLQCRTFGEIRPIKLGDCFYFEQFDKEKCSILYLYEEKTEANWLMQSQTFSNCKVLKNIQEGKFNVYLLNTKYISKDCNNNALTKLTEATTFIYQGSGYQPIRIDGYISAADLLEKIDCKVAKGFKEEGEGEGEEPKKIKSLKSLKIQLDQDATYQIRNKGKSYSINIAKKAHRVRIISFSNEDNFNVFVRKLKKLKLPIFVRTEEVVKEESTEVYLRIYLGGFKTKSEAIKLRDKLKINPRLLKIFNDNKLLNIIYVDEV